MSVTGFLICQAIAARSAELTNFNVGNTSVLKIQGEIKVGDADKTKQQINDRLIGRIELNSPGGAFKEALEIGQLLGSRDIETYVGPNEVCASSCAYIWLSSKRRILTATSKLGFHAIYLNDPSKTVSSDGNAMAGAYLARLGFNDFLVTYATGTPPESIRWLNSTDAKFLGLDVVWQSDDAAATANPAQIPSPISKPLLTLEEVDTGFASVPLLAQIKQKFPDEYHRLIVIVFQSESSGKSADALAQEYFQKKLKRKVTTYLSDYDIIRMAVVEYNALLAVSHRDLQACAASGRGGVLEKASARLDQAMESSKAEELVIYSNALERGLQMQSSGERRREAKWLERWVQEEKKKLETGLGVLERTRLQSAINSKDPAALCKVSLFLLKDVSKNQQAALYLLRTEAE